MEAAKEELLSHARAALIRCDCKRAIGYYEQLLRDHHIGDSLWRRRSSSTSSLRKEVYVGYANAIAACESSDDDVPLAGALDVYRQLTVLFADVVDARLMERVLSIATALLVERVRRAKKIAKCIKGMRLPKGAPMAHHSNNHQQPPPRTAAGHNDLASRAGGGDDDDCDELSPSALDVDPLLCGVCDDLLKVPVTGPCGHTYCRECMVALRQCRRCDAPLFSSEEDYLEKDVFISRLVDRWWGPELKAAPINAMARHYLAAGHLDQALRSANESLEQAPNGFTGLLIRSEVLCGLGQFQSSLADAENALRARPSSAKAHYRRAGALTGLSLYEAALISYCIGCACDRFTIPSSVRHEMAKLLHQILLPGPTLRHTSVGRRWNRQWMMDGVKDSENRRQVKSPRISPNEEPFRKRRKLSHSIEELVAALSDHEEEDSVERFELRRRRRKRNRAHKTEFHRIRHFSYSSSDPADQAPFSIGDKAIVMAALTETNLFVDEEEEVEAEEQVTMPMINIDDLLDRIFVEVEKDNDDAVFVNKNLVEPSDFDCVLCYRPLWRPVVTPCGHTYCSICLDRCMDYRQQCPLCMAPIADALSLTKRNPTLFLEAAMKRFIPKYCDRRRRRQSQEEVEPKVPIFICTAAFPNVPCPLLVSEPRYRLMLRQVIESGERQFGMTHLIGVPTANGRQQYSEYGTMLDIRDCVLLENGWSILSTVGSRRFRVVSKGERDGFDTAQVEFICDSPVVGKENGKQVTALHKEVFSKAISWFKSLPETYKTEIVKSFGQMPEPEDGWISMTNGPAWTWWVIAILPLSQQLKGKIIAEISLEKRLKAIDKTLRTLQDRNGTRSGQKMRHAGVARSHAATTEAYAVNAEVVDAQTVDCCQRIVTSGSSSMSMLEDRPSPNQSTQFLL